MKKKHLKPSQVDAVLKFMKGALLLLKIIEAVSHLTIDYRKSYAF